MEGWGGLCVEELGGGGEQGSCELWAVESSLLQTDPSWADLECWEFSLPALSLPSYPSEVPPAPHPLPEAGRVLEARRERVRRMHVCACM